MDGIKSVFDVYSDKCSKDNFSEFIVRKYLYKHSKAEKISTDKLLAMKTQIQEAIENHALKFNDETNSKVNVDYATLIEMMPAYLYDIATSDYRRQ